MPFDGVGIKNDLKSLRIYHGAVRRLFKDIEYYEDEEAKLADQLKQIKNAEKCLSEQKRAEAILQETVNVLPTIQESLKTNLKKLYDIVNDKFHGVLYFNENEIKFCPNYNVDNIDGGIEELKEKFPCFEDLFKEVQGINQTLTKVFLKFKNVSFSNCGQSSGNDMDLPKEEEVVGI